MTGHVVRDYFTAFRWSNVKIRLKAYHWYFYIYMFVLLPLLNVLNIRGGNRQVDLARTLTLDGMAVFVVFAALLHPVTVPKILYLCPLKREQRRKYIRKAWLLKIAIPTGMSALLTAALYACGKISLFKAIQITMVMTTLAISVSVAEEESTKKQATEKTRRNIWEVTGDGWIMAAIIMFTVVTSLMITLYGADENVTGKTDEIIIGAVSAVIEIPLTVQALRRIRRKLAALADYEEGLRSNGG